MRRSNCLHCAMPLALLILTLGLAGCGEPTPPTGAEIAQANANTPGYTAPGNTPAANTPATHAPAANAPAAEPAPAPSGKGVQVVIETSKGTIEAELNREKAPITVDNFVKYAKKGHYNGTIFHRVIPGFMIQGGGFTPDMNEKPTDAPIKNEAENGLKNDRGTLAMARTGDPNSATSQFFINVVDNEGLNRPNPDGHGYAVFGKVTKGMDVVDAIVAVPTGTRGGHENVPNEPVTIKSVKVK
jgi:cyclophilin family peptidyl-prolyl cis-trans isomerase